MDEQTRLPLTRTLSRLRNAFWRRRVVHWTIRASWLALLVPTVIMAGYVWRGWSVSWIVWVPLMLLVATLSLLWSLRPIRVSKMAFRLDTLLGMRAHLITAVEVSHTADETTYRNNPIAEQLVYDAVNTGIRLRGQIKVFSRGLWLEMQALVAVAAVLGALLIFDVLDSNIPQATPIDLPPVGQEPRADEIIPPDPTLQEPSPAEQELQSASEEQLQDALQALADALRDQAVSRSVSEAIDRGDLGEAAENVRRLTDQLEALSEQARQELGGALQAAADDIGQGLPSLTDPLQQGSDSLERGDVRGAGQALENLAEVLDTIDETEPNSPEPDPNGQPEESGETQEQAENELTPEPGEEPDEGEEGGGGTGEGEEGEGDQPPDEEEERLPIDGEALELENEMEEIEDRVLQPSELNAESDGDQTSDSPFARQPLNAAGDDLGPDPLNYPWEKRDIIRQYFSP